LADVGDEAGVLDGCRLGVVEHVDDRGDRGESSCAIGCPRGGAGKFNSDAVLGDRYGGDGQFIIIEGRAIDLVAFVGDEDVGVQDQASAYGSRSSVVTSASASAMSWANRSSGGAMSASAVRRSAPVRRRAGPISATGW
jgi:hypothetical protein